MSMAGKESDQDIVTIVQEWQNLESAAISHAYELMRRSHNPFIKLMADMIIHDSEKHRHLQLLIMDTLKREALHINPDELNELSDVIYRHVAAEEEIIRFAEAALEKCRQVSTHFLLSYLIADEKKHHSLVTHLDELRRASVSTSVSARPYRVPAAQRGI